MFKGLRTKIEIEQKGGRPADKTPGTPSSNARPPLSSPAQREHGERYNQTLDLNQLASRLDSTISSIGRQTLESKDQLASVEGAQINVPNSNIPGTQGRQNNDLNLQDDQKRKAIAYQQQLDHGSLNEYDRLKAEVESLSNRLSSVIEERDENIEQNVQLYQLIEKLRKNLDSEKQQNSNLQNKLRDAESALKDRMGLFSENLRGSNLSKTMDALAPDGSLREDQNPVEVIKLLQNEIVDLQNQLVKKNKQLKIKQQNLNDMKKSLQKEIIDHGKTQDQLHKLEIHIKQLEASKDDRTKNGDQIVLQNGIKMCDTENTNMLKSNSYQKLGDKNHETLSVNTETEDIMTNNSIASHANNHNQPLDSISCMSKSSASMDDCDSNIDLQHQANPNKQVNHEYLRNVLFRYMTSIDSETSQHLVKALSAMMDFTPEQSKAIKSAMNARSSWLRLK